MATIDLSEKWLRDHAPKRAGGKAPDLGPDERPRRYFDSELSGFGVVLGAKFVTFFYRDRVATINPKTNKPMRRDITIGRWGLPGAGENHAELWNEPRARKEAGRKMGQVVNDIDPIAAKSNSVGGPTLREGVNLHLARMRKRRRAQRSIDSFIHETSKYLADYLDRPMTELTGAKLIELHEQIKAKAKRREGTNPRNPKGAPIANRVVTHVSAAWNALNKKLEGKLGSWNPAKAVDKDVLKEKRVRVADEDLPDYAARVATMKNPIGRDGLMLALYTGLRNEDVREIRFDEVDFVERTLHRPDPKGGEGAAFTIPLSATPMEILLRRKADNARDLGAPDGGWAFPGINRDGEVGPICDLRQQVQPDPKKKTKHRRFPSEDVHTLRRTWESIAHEEGVTELDQHVLSNHSFGSHNVNATYISQHLDHLAACADKIDAGITRRIKGEAAGNRSRRSGT